MFLIAAAIAATATHTQSPPSPAQTCSPQPLPAAIDAIGAPPSSETIEFSATPSFSTQPWVVRLSHRRELGSTIEIIRLSRQYNCNRYNVEMRWQAPLTDNEYEAVSKVVSQLGTPPATSFIPSSRQELEMIVMDGTGLQLRLRNSEWEVTRALNQAHPGGTQISSFFRGLVAKYIPVSDIPAEDWMSVGP